MATIATWHGTPIDPTLLTNRGYTDPVVVDGVSYPRVVGYMAAALANAVEIVGTGVPGGPVGKSQVPWTLLPAPSFLGSPQYVVAALPSTYNRFRFEFDSVTAVAGSTGAFGYLRFSYDNGSTFNGDLVYGQSTSDFFGAVNTFSATTGNGYQLTRAQPAAGNVLSGFLEFARAPNYGCKGESQIGGTGTPNRYTVNGVIGVSGYVNYMAFLAVTSGSTPAGVASGNFRLLGAV